MVKSIHGQISAMVASKQDSNSVIPVAVDNCPEKHSAINRRNP